MSVLAGLRSVFLEDETVGGMVADRIMPVLFEEGCQLPALTLHLVGGSSAPTFETSGPQKVRVQVDCHGESYGEADMLRDAVISVLNGYVGLLSDGTYLQNAEYLQPIDFFESGPRHFRCSCEFYLYFNL